MQVATDIATRDDVIKLLTQLVSIESVNPYFPGGQRGEVAMAAFVSDYCGELGLEVREQAVLPGRSNVLAELKVPGATRTLLLDSHMDTVSLDLMGAEGLLPRVDGDTLTGRGSCDTKSSLAAMLIALTRLARQPKGLGCNVLLLASVDEEYLMRGAEAFALSGIHVDGSIVGEPTKLDVVVAHKGFVRWRMHTVGRAAHSSNPEVGDNAVYQMASLISMLRPAVEERLAAKTHPLVGKATWSVGTIRGGSAVNIVPERCTVEIDRRLLPRETGAEALGEFDALVADICRKHPEIKVERDEPFGDVLGLDTPTDTPVVQALATACRDVRGWSKTVGVAYGTNASKFVLGEIPSIVFGPGDVRQAHTADEFVSIDEVVAAARIYEAAARAF